MQTEIAKWIGYLWIGFLLVWGIAAITQKRTVRRDSSSSRFLQLALAVVAAVLLFDRSLSLGLLERPFLPKGAASTYLGFVLTIAGIGFALCARFFIGRNWSGAVTVKKDHELIRTGPYSVVRHPIYTGVLLGLLGTAMAMGPIRGLLGVGVAALALWIKSRREEVFMSEQFGADYAQYKQKVKALIPFVW